MWGGGSHQLGVRRPWAEEQEQEQTHTNRRKIAGFTVQIT